MEHQWLPSNFSEAPWLKQSMVKLGSLMAVPLFGPSKTICGIVLARHPRRPGVIGLGWRIGALIGSAALPSDLVASFVTRRLELAPSSQAIGLDRFRP